MFRCPVRNFVTDAEDPARILTVLRDALPAGSHLTLDRAWVYGGVARKSP